MVELGFKKPSIEPVTPNTDTIRDAVNPLRGLQEVSVGIDKATKVLEEMQRESIISDSYTRFSQLSADSDKRFMEYTNNLNMSDIPKAGDKLREFVDGPLRRDFENWLSSISDKQVRQHFRTQTESDLRSYTRRGLELKIGAMLKNQEENVIKNQKNAVDKIHIDPSDENYYRQLEIMTNHIDSLPMNIEKKQEQLNTVRKNLSKEKVTASYVTPKIRELYNG